MTKKQLQAELDRVRGIVAPAATAPAPWYAEAPPIAVDPLPVRAAEPPKPAAPVARPWKHTANGVSKAGNPYMVFTTPMKNGTPFNCTVPADLVAFIRSGR